MDDTTKGKDTSVVITRDLKESTRDEEITTGSPSFWHRDENRLFPGDEGFDEHNSSVEFVINEWAQGTSIHGVPYVTDASMWRLWKRLVWVVLVLVASGFMLWQITALCVQFRNYDIITDTQTINPEALEFPEITVCQDSSFSRSRQNETGIFDPLTDDQVELIATPVEDFILNTTFNLETLDIDVWQPTLLTQIGRCYSFRTDRMVRRPGFFGGLELVLNLNQDDFEIGTQYAAAFIYATRPGSKVNILQTPAVVGPGRESFLVMDLIEFSRERTAPWSRCARQQANNPSYTQSQCRVECVDAAVREKCGCREFGDTVDITLPYCSSINEDCVVNNLDNETEILRDCDQDCSLPACFEQTYRLSHIAIEPSEQILESLSNEYDESVEYIRRNIISLTINYRALEYTLLTESEGLTLNQLLGAIGGSMGFFLGISLVSVFELLGDLIGMRLIPRLFGHRHLHGMGARMKQD